MLRHKRSFAALIKWIIVLIKRALRLYQKSKILALIVNASERNDEKVPGKNQLRHLLKLKSNL